MKIWLDITSTTQISLGDCDNDCIPECDPNYIPNMKRSVFAFCQPFVKDKFLHLRTSLLRQAEPLHRQQCEQDRWLVCNPTGSGTVAVLDHQVNRLLDQFRSARLLGDVQAAMPEVAPERIEATTALLHQSGLLYCDSSPSAPSPSASPQTLTAWLHVTNLCNLRCNYCYVEKSHESMTEDTALRSVDAVFRSALKQRFKKVRLKYAGGEASLHMSRVISIHDYATEQAQDSGLELSATLLTNGVVLSRRAIDSLKLRHISVSISLDGIGEAHDRQRPFQHGQASFKYVNATIQRLLENDLAPHISVTVSQRNLDGLSELLEYILARGLSFSLSYYRDNEHAVERDTLQFGEMEMIKGMRTAFAVIERQLPRRSLLGSLIDKANLNALHQRTCGVGNNYLVIDQHGQVAKCHANIKDTISTIYADDPLQVIRNDRKSVQNLAVDEKEGCRNCDWRYWCGGGCPLLTYRLTKRYDIKSPNCTIYRVLFPDALRLEGLRLLKYEDPIVF